MNLILRFLKPHWKLCLITVVLLIVDVAGALFIPTLVAEMLNDGTSGVSFDAIVRTGIHMAAVSVLAGVCAIRGATPAPPWPPRWARTCGRPSTPSP